MRSLLICSLLLTFLIGCAPTPQKIDPTRDRLARISSAYLRACQQGTPPTKQEELTPLLKATEPPADTFLSERDHQPFVIVWNVNALAPQDRIPILAYEQQGREGKRFVVDTMQNVREIAANEFAQLPFPAGHSPK